MQLKSNKGAEKPRQSRKTMLLIAGAAAVIIVLIFSYFILEIRGIVTGPAPQSNYTAPLPPKVYGALSAFTTADYGNAGTLVPVAILNYSYTNATAINATAELFASQVPRSIYVLQTAGECYNCGNSGAIDSYIQSDLAGYGLINSTGLSSIGLGNLTSIRNGSILIVQSGLMPEQMLLPMSSKNTTPMQYLMDKGVSVIYIGGSLSNLLLSGSVVVPTNSSLIPQFLSFASRGSVATPGYYFNQSTFYLTNGAQYGAISYVNYANGSFVAFSNYPTSWNSPQQLASDIAKAVYQLFWMPKYASGSTYINTTAVRSAVGTLALQMDNSTLRVNSTGISKINNAYGRIIINATSSSSGKNYSLFYVYFRPEAHFNGTVSMGTSVLPGANSQVIIDIFTGSSTPVYEQPVITVYNSAMKVAETIPLSSVPASGNFTFIKEVRFDIPSGKYMAVVSTGHTVGAALFTVPQISLSMIAQNVSGKRFTLGISAGGVPISNMSYTITLNGQYPQKGTVSGGQIVYQLPGGAVVPKGSLNFSIATLGAAYSYIGANKGFSLAINKEYIEIAIVLIIVLLEVKLVKAPNRDEFYIDVADMPAPPKERITIRPNEILNVFDRVNLHYRWKYMPLSQTELRNSIADYIKHNNLPVSLTFSNLDVILDQLILNGLMESVDGLYAPKEWISKSGHDIEYLATFKKLRLYLVTHAYFFTDIDASDTADMVVTLKGEKAYVVIYSKTSKFSDIPVYPGSTTYIAFLNNSRREDFRDMLFRNASPEIDKLRIYISEGHVKLVDSDSPAEIWG
jgi:hypothetical protein